MLASANEPCHPMHVYASIATNRAVGNPLTYCECMVWFFSVVVAAAG